MMQIDLSAKAARNLSVLKKIDSNVLEIISEASDTAIYKFDASQKKWDRYGVQGAVFITQNIQAPFHSLIVLNKLGPEDFVLDLTVVRNAKIQDLFIMIKYATSGAPTIIGLWLRDDTERVELLKAVLSLSGESSGLSGLKAPTPNGSLIRNISPAPTPASSTEKSSLLLQMLSSSASKSSNSTGNGFLTDKEISAKNVSAATKSNQSKISEDQIRASTTATSPSSSSFLKSMLNVSSAPPPVPVVTPESKRPVRTPPPPLNSSIESTNPTVHIPPGSANGASIGTISYGISESETQSTTVSLAESPLGSGSRGGDGGGLVPGIIRLKSMAKKEKSVAVVLTAPVPTPVSVPIPSSVPAPTSASATSSSMAFIAATPTASSFPSVPVSSSASASLLAALSIQLKPATERGFTPPPVPRSDVATGEVTAPRRVSMSQLFQSQSKISVTIQKDEAATGATLVAPAVTRQSVPVSVSVLESGSRSTVSVSVLESGSRSAVSVSAGSAGAGPSQQKESSSKSASLCSMLNMPQKDAKLSEQVQFKSSQQSKAMPSASSPATTPEHASQKSYSRAESGSTVSLTPQALARVELADPKNTQTRLGNAGSSSSPFFASSSVYSSAQPPTSTSPPIFSSRKLSPTKSSMSSPISIPVPQGLPPTVPEVTASPSPSSYIIPGFPQHLLLSGGFAPRHGGVVSAVDSTQLQRQSAVVNSSEILGLVQGPPSTPVPTMKSLSPSDLTGYIRKF